MGAEKRNLATYREVLDESLKAFSRYSGVDYRIIELPGLPLQSQDGKKALGYGLRIEAEKTGVNDEKFTKVLWNRAYYVGPNSQNRAAAHAFKELLAVMTGVFLTTAEKSTPDVLEKVSNPDLEVDIEEVTTIQAPEVDTKEPILIPFSQVIE